LQEILRFAQNDRIPQSLNPPHPLRSCGAGFFVKFNPAQSGVTPPKAGVIDLNGVGKELKRRAKMNVSIPRIRF
jgi:hypothetical protein